MIQPATLTEREAAGGQKNHHLLWLRRFGVTVAAGDVTKLEVTVEVYAEMILMQIMLLFVVVVVIVVVEVY
jgi:hypothetical protein